MEEVQHTEQTLRAVRIISQYCHLKGETLECLEETLIDLITDVLVLGHMEGEDIDGIFRMVASHVSAETEMVEVKREEVSWQD